MSRSFKAIMSPDRKRKLKQMCSLAVTGLGMTLEIAKEVSGDAGVPGLQAGIGGLLYILKAAQKSSQNLEDVTQLVEYIDELNGTLRNAQNQGTLSPAIVQRMDKLSSKWSDIKAEADTVLKQSLIKRLITSGDDESKIKGYIQAITWSIQNLMVESMLAIEFTLGEHVRFVHQGLARIERKIDNSLQRLNPRFDCQDLTACLEGTRTDILDQLYLWADLITDPNASAVAGPSSSYNDSSIFWMNGSAGTGKTTIAFTFADMCNKRGILGASFFCSRDDADCSNIKNIVPTIADHLGKHCPAFRTEAARVLEADPDIGYCAVPYQLEHLIVKPLQTLGSAFPRSVVVIDALDECKDDSPISILLTSLSNCIHYIPSLKILITSRPEPNLNKGFQSASLKPVTQRVVLHEIELGVVENDIERYTIVNLERIREYHGLEASWPSEKDVRTLVQSAYGLFISASTHIKFVEDRSYRDPRGQLQKLVKGAEAKDAEFDAHKRLDDLYMQVLMNAFPEISPSLSGRLKMVLGTIGHLHDPLPALEIELLLESVEAGAQSRVKDMLEYLHSVIIVPEDERQVVRSLHPSFFEFLVSPVRCSSSRFLVTPKVQHSMLAQACLSMMSNLRRNICEIEDHTTLNREVLDLPTRIRKHVPPHLQYACRFWASHLKSDMLSDNILHLLREFSSKYLLYWIEVCSLLGELRNAILALDAARRVLSRYPRNDMKDCATLLLDGERFVREYFPVINAACTQVYHSALLFTPKETLLRKTYVYELAACTIKMHNGRDKAWMPCMRIMDGHAEGLMAAALSPDDTRIVSGSNDKTIRLWDAVSGAHLNTLKGHDGEVWWVRFSPDGTRILSGSSDKTARIWDAASGAQLHVLQGHTDGIWSVAFSPDGTRVGAASADHTVRLWDASNGKHLRTLEGPTDFATSVWFSPDSSRVVSGSKDTIVRLWEVSSGALLKTYRGHTKAAWMAAFSSNGEQLVTASEDKTCRVWSTNRGTTQLTLKGHTKEVWSVAFSADTTRIVSGSADQTIRLWDAVSGAHLTTFEGHSDYVSAVHFTSDGTRIVSSSVDKTVRLWDAVSWTGTKPSKTRSGVIVLVAFSSDGKSLASGSADNVVQLWDVGSGKELKKLEGHSNWVSAVAFSSDGKCIVSGSQDRTLRIWSAGNGTQLQTLQGHSDAIQSVAFSPDGMRVASGSRDNTVRLWNATNGALLNTLEGHSGWVNSVLYISDGKRIVSGSEDKTLRVWDTITGTHINTLTGHSAGVNYLALSADGLWIISGSSDQTVNLWDVGNGSLLKTLNGLPHNVVSLSFSSEHEPGSFDDKRLLEAGNGVYATLAKHDEVFGLSSTFTMENGWIYTANLRKRVCWVPMACRGRMASAKKHVAFGTDNGRVIFMSIPDVDVTCQTSRLHEVQVGS